MPPTSKNNSNNDTRYVLVGAHESRVLSFVRNAQTQYTTRRALAAFGNAGGIFMPWLVLLLPNLLLAK